MSHLYLRLVPLALALPWLASGAIKAPFVDEFDDNSNQWPAVEETDLWSGVIADGRFVCEYLEPESKLQFSKLPVQVEAQGAFEITLAGKGEEGGSAWQFGVTFDRIDAEGKAMRHYFDISSQGKFRMWDYVDGQFINHRLWTEHASLRDPKDHVLTLRRIGDTLYFLINGQSVGYVPFYGLSQQAQFGVTVGSGSFVSFDRFAVTYLEGNQEELAKLGRKMVYDTQAFEVSLRPPTQDFHETFDDNSRNWPFLGETDRWSAKVEDGVLTWINKQTEDSKHRAGISIPFNGAADYDVSYRTRWASGANDVMIGLSWGLSANNEDGFESAIAPNGYYSSSVFLGGKNAHRTSWRKSSLVRAKDWNEIRVRRLGRTVFIFLNGQLLTDVSTSSLPGDRLAVTVGQNTGAEFDDIRVTFPQKTWEQTEAERAEYIATLTKNHGKADWGVVYSVKEQQEKFAAANAKERADMGLDDPEPSAKDRKELAKVRRQWTAKPMLSLMGSWKRPRKEIGNDYSLSLFYFYKQIGAMPFYYEFQIRYSGPLSNDKFELKHYYIENVQLTSEREISRMQAMSR